VSAIEATASDGPSPVSGLEFVAINLIGVFGIFCTTRRSERGGSRP
jgi:hypothetical protein